MVYKVAVVGDIPYMDSKNIDNDLLLRVLSMVTDSSIKVVEPSHAELVVVYPYRWPFRSTLAGAALQSLHRKVLRRWGPEQTLRSLYRLPRRTKLLFVSPENLERRPWQVLGNIVSQTDIPRLTFWPEVIDPSGFRFPYWWNYVEWVEIPRPEFSRSTRFGALYDLDTLLSDWAPPQHPRSRQERAIWLVQHLDFPRQQVLEQLRRTIDVDVVSNVPFGKKMAVLETYKYCVVTENSVGYGYETEKLPEARLSGCIPIGFIGNPLTEFNPDAALFGVPKGGVQRLPPLLRNRPDINSLFSYLAGRL